MLEDITMPIEIKRCDPVISDAPRYPNWEVKEVGLVGIERRTIMTEEEYKIWQSKFFGNL